MQIGQGLSINKIEWIIKNTILAIYVFLTLFFPDSYRVIRLVVLMLLATISIIEKPQITMSKGTKLLFLFLIINVTSMIWGLINNAPGALRTQTVDFIWPVLFFFIGQTIDDEYKFFRLIILLLVSYFCVCLFDIMYVISSLIGITIPGMDILTGALECNFGNYGVFLQFTTTHMCTHIYMVPFTISLLRSKDPRINKRFVIIISGMALICVLASGRVALIITSSICSILGIIMMKEDREKHRIKKTISLMITLGIFAISIFMISQRLGVDLSAIKDYIIHKFASSADATNIVNGVRAIQGKALISGWLESPIIGHGSGSYTPLCIRDENMVWAYEYTYHALLFQKGLLGFVVTFAFYGWIIVRLIKKRNKQELCATIAIPFVCGFIAILIATYADPYLGKMGCMWMLFFPFAIANSRSDSKLINLIGEGKMVE